MYVYNDSTSIIIIYKHHSVYIYNYMHVAIVCIIELYTYLKPSVYM